MKNIISIILFVIAFSVSEFAQYGTSGTTDARSMSMGNTSNAISAGVFSVGLNPANLLNSPNTVDFTTVLPLPFLSIGSGTNFISINDINYFFGTVDGKPRVLTDADKQRLNSLFENGGLVYANASLNIFSFGVRISPTVGAIGFSINDYIDCEFTIPQAISNLLMNGNTPGRTYNFNDTKIKSWWIRDYSLTYARDIYLPSGSLFNKISAGLSIKLVQGYSYVQSTNVNTTFLTDNNNKLTFTANNSVLTSFSDDFNVKYSFDSLSQKDKSSKGPFPSPAGTGVGFDFGLNASFGTSWNFSFAITDIGSINWDKNTAITSSSGEYSVDDLFDKAQGDSLKNRFKGTSNSTGSFSTNLPTALRLGASYKFDFNNTNFPGTLLMALDLNQGFNDQPGNSKITRISIGAEWKPMDWIPFIRTGFSFGGLLGFHWALGIGINAGALEFNLGTLDMQSLAAPNSARYLCVAFDSRWKF